MDSFNFYTAAMALPVNTKLSVPFFKVSVNGTEISAKCFIKRRYHPAVPRKLRSDESQVKRARSISEPTESLYP